MPFNVLKKTVNKMYGTALLLRDILPPERRHIWYTNFLVATLFLLAISITAFAFTKVPASRLPFLEILPYLAPRLYGLFLVMFSISFIFSTFEALHRSYYFTGLKSILNTSKDSTQVPVSWEVATIVHETGDDITYAFLISNYGQEVLYRVGVTEEAFLEFEKKRSTKINPETFIVERHHGVVLASYARTIYKHDTEFRTFLAEHGINEEALIQAAQWVTEIERNDRKKKRWWARDNLGKVPGLGKSWSYGQTYYLERYGHDLKEDHVWQSALIGQRQEEDEVEELEQLLARKRQTNALMLTNDVVSARRRVAQLYRKIQQGTAFPPLESRRIFFVDVEAILIGAQQKADFEKLLRKTFDQAIHAGNIVLYFEHLSAIIQSTKIIGVDFIEVITPYLDSSEIQIVIGEYADAYEKQLAHDNRITQAFDVVQMLDVSQNGVIQLLKQRAVVIEKETNIVFTIPALQRIGELADRYFPTGVMPDKAFDLLEELVPLAIGENILQVLQTHVEELVARKTHVPVGAPKEEERDTLLNLEAELHKRVIGQEKAVKAVAEALRRARSGISNPKKPMGTFLFLGPTGVGKTETAKALSEILFDDEDAMSRLDMSEFQSAGALQDLIGSVGTQAEGRLESLVRKRQYGVLLLDEFEKSHKTVQDLFLQILDEGRYTTASGNRVNLRNLVIIATSNAGADLIWEWEKEGKDVAVMKDPLVDYMIHEGLYRPELLNRFDDIVVFHSLKRDHVKDIVRIHLNNFAKYMRKEKNIEVEVTDALVHHIAEKGYDPKFGGRPLNRAIQSELEQRIADKIIAGELAPGGTYVFQE